MEPIPVLIGREGLLTGQQWVITPDGLRLGREPGNEVRIDDAGISRQHARVLLHNGVVWVQDAGSRNGVFVNGERVPDHKQVKPGDRVVVGNHAFEIGLVEASASPAATVSAPAVASAGSPGWRIWPFVLVAVLVFGCVGCFGLYGAVRSGGEDVSVAPTKPAYSLSGMLEDPPAGGAQPTVDPSKPPPTVQDALAVAVGADEAAQRAQLPDPPPGSTEPMLIDKAASLYESGRLTEARTHYQMALKLNPECEICAVRIARINTQIAERAQSQFDAGMRAYESMQFTHAEASWEAVLQLVPDPADPMHVRAAEYLEKVHAAKHP